MAVATAGTRPSSARLGGVPFVACSEEAPTTAEAEANHSKVVMTVASTTTSLVNEGTGEQVYFAQSADTLQKVTINLFHRFFVMGMYLKGV